MRRNIFALHIFRRSVRGQQREATQLSPFLPGICTVLAKVGKWNECEWDGMCAEWNTSKEKRQIPWRELQLAEELSAINLNKVEAHTTYHMLITLYINYNIYYLYFIPYMYLIYGESSFGWGQRRN